MIIRALTLILLLNSIVYSNAQDGSSADPFTALNQALTVTSDGIYYFNISGVTFDTHVTTGGYIQIAIDFGNGSSDLPQSNSLTTTNRGILTPAALATLGSAMEVRITSSTGNVDVTTSNATVISRVTSNSTLHRGQLDNSIHDDWTGTGAVFFIRDASGQDLSVTDLNRRIFHPWGNTNTFHWQPYKNQQRERFVSGDVANAVFFQIWVRNSAPLPIELHDFRASLRPNQEQVEIRWQTAAEINNDYFTVERSKDGIQWTAIDQVIGAGYSVELLSYSTMDKHPLSGVNYYRVKQTDFDGTVSYSPIQSVQLKQAQEEINIFPNPTTDFITITSATLSTNELRISDSNGTVLNHLVRINTTADNTYQIDLNNLPQGIYLLNTDRSVKQFIKK